MGSRDESRYVRRRAGAELVTRSSFLAPPMLRVLKPRGENLQLSSGHARRMFVLRRWWLMSSSFLVSVSAVSNMLEPWVPRLCLM